MNLLIDLGNSRLKWACYKNNHLQASQHLLNSQLSAQVLRNAWQDLKPQKIAISSVGKIELLNVIKSVAQELWSEIPIHFSVSQAQAFGVKNAYLQPEKLGVDRWLALIAAKQKMNSPVCIVDCGTAITVDVLNENSEHQGGLICTGLTLMRNALASNTAALPLSVSTQNIGLARETQAAIFNGTLFAACGLIEKVLADLPENTQLFLTGGDAELIAAQLKRPFTLEMDLVLQGLALELNSSLF